MSALHILIVEALESPTELLLREILKRGHDLVFGRAASREEALAAMDTTRWDAVLSDDSIPGFGAIEVLASLRERGLDLPLILISDAISEESEVAALRAGVDDVLLRSRLSRVMVSIERALRERQTRLIQEQRLGAWSHDLKNPLGAIHLNLQIILRSLDSNLAKDPTGTAQLHKQIRTHVERAQKSSQRILQMVQDFLDQPKIRGGQPGLSGSEEDWVPKPHAAADPGAGPGLALQPARPRVFVVDDDPEMQEVFGEVLEQMGCEVTRLESGEAALRVCAESIRGPLGAPDLMVLDFQLPGMNGGQLAAAIKALGGRWSSVPMVLSSGDESVKAADLGLQAQIHKPPTLENFIRVVRSQLPKL